MNVLFWLDMEMTGLNPQIDRILEVALIVTDLNFQVQEVYETIVFQPESVLLEMNNWCQQIHQKSGLLSKISSGKKEPFVEQDLVQIFKKYQINQKPALLAGNSIGQDRKFIDCWMPELSKLLHYRMLDVSSFKIVFEQMYSKKFEKQNNHRAQEDILESIAELKYYLSFLSITPQL